MTSSSSVGCSFFRIYPSIFRQMSLSLAILWAFSMVSTPFNLSCFLRCMCSWIFLYIMAISLLVANKNNGQVERVWKYLKYYRLMYDLRCYKIVKNSFNDMWELDEGTQRFIFSYIQQNVYSEVASKQHRKATASKYTISYQNKDFNKSNVYLCYSLSDSVTETKFRYICIGWYTYKHNFRVK